MSHMDILPESVISFKRRKQSKQLHENDLCDRNVKLYFYKL